MPGPSLMWASASQHARPTVLNGRQPTVRRVCRSHSHATRTAAVPGWMLPQGQVRGAGAVLEHCTRISGELESRLTGNFDTF